MAGPVVVLAGGTGGAKLARGMLDVAGADLVVVANTGDDIEIHGAHVAPDPDLVTFWLADRIDERGWGLAGDTFHVMDGLRELGDDIWFQLGDRDLAVGLLRARRLAEGARLTDALAELSRAYGLRARVLPMSDDRIRTRVRARGAWHDLQAFLIREQGRGPVEEVAFDGAQAARATPEVLDALSAARAIVLGPSNPVISLGPILATPGVREALVAASAPVVAVSPIVGGEVLKGPTAAFLQGAGQAVGAAGAVAALDPQGWLDGVVCDEEAELDVPVLRTDTRMADAAGRRRVAQETLRFAEALA
ncbi:MAG TPA: 2-phospho-L-lactate transferase [Baekduia sp.]|nr:2-phospho-L-lactate transferase [Baekduia sp.]